MRLSGDEPAGLWVSSIPWPSGVDWKETAWRGASGGTQPTTVLPIGQWPEVQGTGPRRLLTYGLVNGGGAPDKLSLKMGGKAGEKAGRTEELPAYREHCFAYSSDPFFVWEQKYLELSMGGKRVGLALGMKRKGKILWWEACRVVEENRVPGMVEVTMGGAIGWDFNDRSNFDGFKNEYLHKHNWLNGHLRVRIFDHGVVELFARHVNSRYVDPGGDCEDGVPVVGFFTEEREGNPQPGVFDGTEPVVRIGGVEVDLTDVAPLASPEQPGQWIHEPGAVVLQPYEGFELFGGAPTTQRYGTPYITESKDGRVLKGMARSLHFSLSLGEAPARIARYLAPSWWYGLQCELSTHPVLPIERDGETHNETAGYWWRDNMVKSGFEVGNLPRSAGERSRFEGGRREPSWEGEVPYALLMLAYQTGNPEDYQAALQSCYYFNDVIVEHADKQVRMHGYPPPALSVPMNRVLANIGAWLETGDPFPRQTAEAVMETSYRNHLNSWPRMAVGRDAAFGRGAMMLYRYLNNPHFREIAREVAYAIHHAQRPDGSFGDQGGGSGIHAWGGYITKPWMGCLGTNIVMDYLELFPEEERLWETAKKYADWLVADRRPCPDGQRTWAYQHSYNGARVFITKEATIPTILPQKGGRWHQQSMGRLFGMVAKHTGNPLYLETYLESNDAHRGKDRGRGGMDHGIAASVQYMPWVNDYFAHAVIGADKTLEVFTRIVEPWGDQRVSITSPWGEVVLVREPGKGEFTVAEKPEGVTVKVSEAGGIGGR